MGSNWGTGVGLGDPRKRDPSQWTGTNMLGWALNEARNALLAGQDAGHFAQLLAVQEEEMNCVAPACELPPGGAGQASESQDSDGKALASAEGASAEAKQGAARQIFKYVTGVLNGAVDESEVMNIGSALALWSDETPSYPSACDALAIAIDAGVVPPQGLQVIVQLAGHLPDHGVPRSARLPQALAAKGTAKGGA